VLHLGGLRTALFNWLFARAHAGAFILRIEDTDRTRLVPGSAEALYQTLSTTGLVPDESPAKGGAFGPYVQSHRKELGIYKEKSHQLLESGHAYRCFCTPERLELLRKIQQKQGLATRYDGYCSGIHEKESRARADAGEPFVIRHRVSQGEDFVVSVEDLLRGSVKFSSAVLDDTILIKSDGFPTYHFASVVDDQMMEISHVIRGEEWLPSAPKHVLLYQAFGWKPPNLIHLPLLINMQRQKLSKRHGDRVAVDEYLNRGIEVSSLLNFVALLGWTPKKGRELFYTLDDMVSEFSFEDVNKGAAVVDEDKLWWFNTMHVRKLVEERSEQVLEAAKRKFSLSISEEYVFKVADAMKERALSLDDLFERSNYFFEDPELSKESLQFLLMQKSVATGLLDMLEQFDSVPDSDFDAEKIDSVLRKVQEAHSLGQKEILAPLRAMITGAKSGTSLASTMAVLGKEVTLRRMSRYLVPPLK
jgi:glutamyl-tRNA synthetase